MINLCIYYVTLRFLCLGKSKLISYIYFTFVQYLNIFCIIGVKTLSQWMKQEFILFAEVKADVKLH